MDRMMIERLTAEKRNFRQSNTDIERSRAQIFHVCQCSDRPFYVLLCPCFGGLNSIYCNEISLYHRPTYVFCNKRLDVRGVNCKHVTGREKYVARKTTGFFHLLEFDLHLHKQY